MARTIELFADGDVKSVTIYAEVVRVPPAGLTIDALRVRMTVLDKLSAAADSAADAVTLEESEWRILHDALKEHRWPMVHRAIIRACDAVFDATANATSAG